jgi:hypothetical protein
MQMEAAITENTIRVPYNESTAHIYETIARIREEIIMRPTPRQWEMNKKMYGDAYTVPKPT